MKIDETLKENLIADVKNILDIELTDNDETALMRCFEITIGNHYASQFRQEVSDEDVKEIVFKLSHGQYAETEGDDFCARMDMLKKWMRNGLIPKK